MARFYRNKKLLKESLSSLEFSGLKIRKLPKANKSEYTRVSRNLYAKCVICENTFVQNPNTYKLTKTCSHKCFSDLMSKIAKEKSPSGDQPHGTKIGTNGAIGEFAVAIHLMSKGYYVFKSMIPTSPFDLIALNENETIYIEVRCGKMQKNGNIEFNKKCNKKVTHFGVYMDLENKVIILPVDCIHESGHAC